jgi:hypothetical protein
MMLRTTALAACAFGLLCAVALGATSSAHVGDIVTMRAHDLKAGRYSLTLVSDHRPTKRSACVAKLSPRRRTSAGKVTLAGTIPERLTCWENDSVRLGRVKVTPGAYHLIVAVPDGPSGFDVRYSFVRRALTIKR